MTTTVLGDVTRHLVGDQAEVITLMTPGADPHSTGVSAQQAQQMRTAELLVSNGLGLEEGLQQHLDRAVDDGVARFVAGEHIDVLQYTSEDASGPDPHFWTDPTRMVAVVDALSAELAGLDGIDTAQLASVTADYREELVGLDQQVALRFADIPAARRALVTNHHVFGYLAERYDFRLVGAIIPGGATLAAPSAADLQDLAQAIRSAGVPAVFADSSQPDRLARVVAEQTGLQIDVVPLFTESLSAPDGEAPTYLEMVRVNADRITTALS
nr:metal ABC transporter substrate-binding protein [Nakamurella alba]